MTRVQAAGISSWMLAIYLLLGATMIYPEGSWQIVSGLSAVNALIGMYRLTQKETP